MDNPRSSFLEDASKTPESPATDSSLTAADTERGLLDPGLRSSMADSEIGDKGALRSPPTDSCPVLRLSISEVGEKE